MNTNSFYYRTKFFNDILHEIFNVESNYRTELNLLNLKIFRKIEDFKKKINQKKIDNLRQSLPIKKTFKRAATDLTLKTCKTNDIINIDKEDNTNFDKLISESLQNLLKFYKTKHNLISKEVSNLGIAIYQFSSSYKKYERYLDTNILEKCQKDFEMHFSQLMKAKKTYFEKMNNLELFFHEEEEKKKKKVEIKTKEKNRNIINDDNQKIDELIELRKQYKKSLAEMTSEQKSFISQMNEMANDMQDFNLTENNLLFDIFTIFEKNLEALLQEIKNVSLLYQKNRKSIQDCNKELGNNLIFDKRLYIGYKFEEYEPMFTDINNRINLSVIQKMNKLLGFEFDKIKTNKPNNDNLADTIIYNSIDLDENVLFILLMDKFIQGENALDEKERVLLKNLFNQDKYLKEFVNKINNMRIERNKFYKKEKFEVLADCFNEIISKISFSNDKNHELVKCIMILSETYFYKEGDNKIYLNKLINFPKEISDIKFWIKYLEKEIEYESKKYKNQNNSRYEFIVLLSNTAHLREFSFEKEKINEIIEYFKNKYKLTYEEIKVIKEQLHL